MPVDILDALDAFFGFAGDMKPLKHCNLSVFESVFNILPFFHACRPCSFSFCFIFFLPGITD